MCELEVNSLQLAAAKGSHIHYRVETDELIRDLKEVANYLGKDSISSKEYEKNGKYSVATYFKRFNTWNAVLSLAELSPFVPTSSRRLKDEELLNEIERVWIRLGRQPASTDIKNGISKYSLHAYVEHFGGWRGALNTFVEYIGRKIQQRRRMI